ncbi:hypothetical protein H4R33_005755 [Dimargaris cristalligena]|nr:hypothetical protein H4R33_005755 [Dimargaris cristalligena]
MRPSQAIYTDYDIPTTDGHHLAATVITKAGLPLPKSAGHLATPSTPAPALASTPSSAATRAQAPPILVICHGLLNTRYSRVVRALAVGLPYHACIFDFRGNGDSSGNTRYGNYLEEAEDLRRVVHFLQHNLGYRVAGFMGHSKGASVMFMYAVQYAALDGLWGSQKKEEKENIAATPLSSTGVAGGEPPLLLVDVAGRFDMTQAPMLRFTAEQQRSLQEQGECVWTHYGPDRDRPYIVRQRDLDERSATAMGAVRDLDMTRSRVLLVHGEDDDVVPVSEAQLYYDTILNGLPMSLQKRLSGTSYFKS